MGVTFTSFMKYCTVQIVLNKVPYPDLIIKKKKHFKYSATFLNTTPHTNTKFNNFKNYHI